MHGTEIYGNTPVQGFVICFAETSHPVGTTIQYDQALITFPFLPLYTFLESMIKSDQA